MAETLRHQRSRITRKLVAPSFDDAGRCSLNDGDRFVELMAMAREPSTGLKNAVAAANTRCAELAAEQILEVGPRG